MSDLLLRLRTIPNNFYEARLTMIVAADRIEVLEAALHDAFMAMCSHRDSADDEIFQDAIDALGLAALDKDRKGDLEDAGK